MASILSRPRNDSPVPQSSKRSTSILSAASLVRSNPEAQMAAMTNVGMLFAIVDRLATSCSQSHWHLYRKARSGKPEDRVELTDHLALRIWRKPNPFTTMSELIEAGQQHFELTGLTVLVVGRNPMSKLPLELWNVRPDRVRPVPHPTKFIAGYVYTSPDGEQVPLSLDDVIIIRRPSPLDPYGAIAPVQAVTAHLEGERLSAEYNRNFFKNGAEPGGIIEVERTLSDTEFDEMTARWREQHQGVANAHRVAVLENAKYVERKYTQKDMEFLGLSKLSDDKIRQAYGIHNAILGGTEDINRANAEAGEYVYARWLLVNRYERWKQALNNDFLPLFGDDSIEFDYDSPVPDDEAAENAERDSKVTAVSTLVPLGFDKTEVLAWADLPDFAYTKPEPPPPPALPAAPAPGEPADDTTAALLRVVRMLGGRQARDGHGGGHRCDCGSDDEWIRAHRARLTNSAQDGAPDDLPEDYDGEDVGLVQEDYEAELADLSGLWVDVRAAMEAEVVAQVREVVAAGDILALESVRAHHGRGAEVLEMSMTRAAQQAGQRVVDDAVRQGIDGMHVSTGDRVRRAALAQLYSYQIAGGIARSAIAETARTWAPGALADDVAGGVAEYLGGLAGADTDRILRGALSVAQNQGRFSTFYGGPVAALYAEEQNDKATCKACSDVDGMWVGNSDDPGMVALTYPNGMYIHCAGHERCRGTVVAIWRGGSDWTKWVERGNPDDVPD